MVASAIVAGQVDVLRPGDIRAMIRDIGQLQRKVTAKACSTAKFQESA